MHPINEDAQVPNVNRIDDLQTGRRDSSQGTRVSLKKGKYERNEQYSEEVAVQTYNPARRQRQELEPWRRSGICRKIANLGLRPARRFHGTGVFQIMTRRDAAPQTGRRLNLDRYESTDQLGQGTFGKIAPRAGFVKYASRYEKYGSQKYCAQNYRRYFYSV